MWAAPGADVKSSERPASVPANVAGALLGIKRRLPRSRYFIELQVSQDPETPRRLRDEAVRRTAFDFVQALTGWLRREDRADDVSALSTTALGQVMIVCTARVIDHIRTQEEWHVAHIRSADQIGDLQRVSDRV